MDRLIARISESLYTIPVAIMLACALLALVGLQLDTLVDEESRLWLLDTTVAGGRAIASAVAGATITVAAIVFSITALTTQMASNQYSPRALGEFFEDRFQQSVIGLVVGTFTYSLLVLGSLGGGVSDGSAASPSVSATIAIVLGVGSALGIVAYINHSLRRMQIDSVVRRIAAGSIDAIERHLERRKHQDHTETPPPRGTSRGIRAESGGWVVGIDEKAMLDALPPGATCRVDVRLGQAVSTGDRILTVWTDLGDDWNGERAVRRSIVTAQERSIELDPTFGIRQLVDIALRALSSGVNDPTTAVDVIHHLKMPVRTILLSDPPQRVFSGSEERRVFLPSTPGRADYVHGAFSEIRLAAAAQPYVLGALMEVLTELISDLREANLGEREGPVVEEFEETVSTVRGSGLPEVDLKRLLEGTPVQELLD